MQQHTGQHVLSAAFVRLFEIPTVSFHLGTEVSTIDLPGTPGPEVIARAEDEANRVVWQNRPVSVRFVSAEEAAHAAVAQGTGAWRHVAPGRGRGLRPVGVRRHARRPHRRHRHHRRAGLGALQGRHAHLVCVRRTRAHRSSMSSGTSWPTPSGSSRSRPAELPDAVTQAAGRVARAASAGARPDRAARHVRSRRASSRDAEDVGGTRLVCARHRRPRRCGAEVARAGDRRAPGTRRRAGRRAAGRPSSSSPGRPTPRLMLRRS